MPIAHGAKISAAAIEREISARFTLHDFVALCNSVLWSLARDESGLPPLFSEQIFAPDKGADAEWYGTLPDDGRYRSGLLLPGQSVMQYKMRDSSAQDRKKIAADLKADLRGALTTFVKRTGAHPQRYTLLTNIDLTLTRKEALKSSILEGCPDSSVDVVIIAAADLAAYLNDLPHIRSAFFSVNRFMTWELGWRAHQQPSPVNLVDREEDVRRLTAIVDDPKCRFLVISGPPQIGKSRLAFEITRHRQIDSVVATDSQVLTLSDILTLEPGTREALLLALEPPLELLSGLKTLLDRRRVKVIATYSKPPSLFTMEDDPRIARYALQPLSENDSHSLLESLNPSIDFGLASWVVHQSGGNPGILIAASRHGLGLRRDASVFVRSVSEAYEQLARDILQREEIRALSALSLLSKVNLSGLDETNALCRVLGMPSRDIRGALDRLENCRFLRRSGSTVEVVPAVFAIHLARKAADGDELWTLFLQLDNSGRTRLATRASQWQGAATDLFWARVFRTDGPLGGHTAPVEYSYLLPIAAAARPNETVNCCLKWLSRLSVEERRLVAGKERRDLMWAANELLFHENTAEPALVMVSLLAEAENESWGNNATGVFCECFRPTHPQFPMPLDERAKALDECCFTNRSKDLGALGVKAICEGLETHGGVMLRQGLGSRPVDTRPALSYAEINTYRQLLIDRLIDIARGPMHVVHEEACQALPGALRDYGAAAHPGDALPRIADVLDLALQAKAPIALAEMANSLVFLRRVYADGRMTQGKPLEELERQIQRLDDGDFETRLMKWAGSWPYFCLDDAQDRLMGKALAGEAIAVPTILDKTLVVWLCSEAARGYQFFYLLGVQDSQFVWTDAARRLGSEKETTTGYIGYFSGLAGASPEVVGIILDEDAARGTVEPSAIVSVTCAQRADSKGFERVERLILEERITKQAAVDVCQASIWMRSLPSDSLVRLVRAIAGPNLESAHLTLELLAFGRDDLALEPTEVQEMAWQMLGNCTFDRHFESNADMLAEKLANLDVDRAFGLFNGLLLKASTTDGWNPLDRHAHARFWDALHTHDRKRAVRTVIQFAVDNPKHATEVRWHFPDVLQQETDSDILQDLFAQGRDHAMVIASVISPEQPGYWSLVMSILRKYVDDKAVQDCLLSNVTKMYYHSGFVTDEQIHTTQASILASVVGELQRSPSAPVQRWLEKCRAKLERQNKDALAEDDDWM